LQSRTPFVNELRLLCSPIETPILDGLGEVRRADAVVAGQIGDGARGARVEAAFVLAAALPDRL